MQKVQPAPLSTFISRFPSPFLSFVSSLSLSLFVSFSRCLHCVHPSQGYILIPFPALVSDNFRPAGNSIRNGAL